MIIPLPEGAPGTEPGKMNSIIFNSLTLGEVERGKEVGEVARNWLKASPSLDSTLDLPATGKKMLQSAVVTVKQRTLDPFHRVYTVAILRFSYIMRELKGFPGRSSLPQWKLNSPPVKQFRASQVALR